MKYLYFAFTILLFSTSCSNKQKENTAEINTQINSDTTSIGFFPVTSFLKGQMAELDSFPVTPLLVTTKQNKIDSLWLKKEAVKALLVPFISDEISENNLTAFFNVTKFKDQSVNAITFTYEPKSMLPDSIAIRHWDIYINPESGKINKVYIVKSLHENGKSYTQQLIWQTNKWAKITTILNKQGDKMELEKEEKLFWDLDDKVN